MCWICFGEKVSPIQSVGILIGVTGVILLGSSKPSQGTIVSESSTQTKDYTAIILYGVFSICSNTIDTLAYKYIFAKTCIEKTQAQIVSLTMLFIYGCGGTICLIVSTCLGQGLYNMSWMTVAMVLLAGSFLHTGLSLYGISIAIGQAGLTGSVFASFVGMQAAISYFFLHQQITKGQVYGMLIQFVGLVILTLGD